MKNLSLVGINKLLNCELFCFTGQTRLTNVIHHLRTRQFVGNFWYQSEEFIVEINQIGTDYSYYYKPQMPHSLLFVLVIYTDLLKNVWGGGFVGVSWLNYLTVPSKWASVNSRYGQIESPQFFFKDRLGMK